MAALGRVRERVRRAEGRQGAVGSGISLGVRRLGKAAKARASPHSWAQPGALTETAALFVWRANGTVKDERDRRGEYKLWTQEARQSALARRSQKSGVRLKMTRAKSEERALQGIFFCAVGLGNAQEEVLWRSRLTGERAGFDVSVFLPR